MNARADDPEISVIIVNYNTSELVRRCVRSLIDQQGIGIQIIVVDNASADDSVASLQAEFGDRITLIPSDTNLGFGRANNLGAESARGRFFYLLNPDTHFEDQDALSQFLAYMEAHPECGLAGSLVWEPRKNRHAEPVYRYPGQKEIRHAEVLQNLPGTIAWVLGASMMIPREVWAKINGFDPDFFLYGEDADICLRIRQAGYEIHQFRDVTVYHASQASEKTAPPLQTRLRKKRGFFMFCRKHYHVEDTGRIARRALRRNRLYIFGLRLQGFFGVDVEEKLQRRRATLIAAQEELEYLLKHAA